MLIGAVAGEQQWPSDDQDLYLGVSNLSPFSANHNYVGLMDDVRLYDHALSQSAIVALFGRTVATMGAWATATLASMLLAIGSWVLLRRSSARA